MKEARIIYDMWVNKEKVLTEENTVAEMTDFQKQFLSKGVGNKLFTQAEFDEALRLAQAEIMTVAVDTTKQAILLERDACAHLVHEMADEEEEGEVCTALRNAVRAILNRIPAQRQ